MLDTRSHRLILVSEFAGALPLFVCASELKLLLSSAMLFRARLVYIRCSCACMHVANTVSVSTFGRFGSGSGWILEIQKASLYRLVHAERHCRAALRGPRRKGRCPSWSVSLGCSLVTFAMIVVVMVALDLCVVCVDEFS